jgi:hypothetical protein
MALSISQIAERVEALRVRYTARDERMSNVLAVRNGDMVSIGADFFPEDMSRSMIANFVDVAARDVAEVCAPLPSINCSTSSSASDTEKKFADKRTQIANHYIQFSELESQNYVGADWYNSYAYYTLIVEPDFDASMPRIRIDNPLNAYPEFDRFGRVVSYSKIYKKTVRELCVDFPEVKGEILASFSDGVGSYNTEVDLVRYEDKDQVVLFLPRQKNLVLQAVPNPMGKMTVCIGRRPSINPDDPRGQFDDVIWVQLARARFAFLSMEAAEKSVQAPIVVPNDVQELAFGPDAILRTQNPAGVRRVGLELSSAAFTEQQLLQQEMRLGSRYPEGRTGNIDASIITGQGVQALLGGFDSQVKAAQQIMARVLEQAISLCFEMDEKIFNFKKSVSGVYQGAPYKFEYKPGTAIKNDYTVQVRYGLMSGLDPSRALIFSLQALGAKLTSKDYVMRELPWSMNVSEVQKSIDIETMREALLGGFASITAAIPQIASQGGDPTTLIKKISDVIQARKSGVSIEDAVEKVFIPEEPPPAPEAAPVEPQPPVEAAVPAAPEQGMPAGAPSSPQQGGPDIMAMLQQMGGQVQ